MHLKYFLRQDLLTGSGQVGHPGPTKRRQARQVVCWQMPRSSWASNAFLQEKNSTMIISDNGAHVVLGGKKQLSIKIFHFHLLCCRAVSVFAVLTKLHSALVPAVVLVVCGLFRGLSTGGGRGCGSRQLRGRMLVLCRLVYRPIHTN